MNHVLLFSIVLLPVCLHAETVFLKDGKVHAAREMRRDGNFLFLKTASPDAAQSEVIVPLNQVDRVEFSEIQALSEARQLARNGEAAGVSEKTAGPASFFRTYSDVPGNQWAEVMRLRLPALAVAGTEEEILELQKQWTPTGDVELDTAYRLLVASQNDPAGARKAREALAKPGANSLAAGMSWLTLGKEALAAKQWKAALNAFLSVEVFVPNQRLLQPKALLGAITAFVAKGERAKATALLDEIRIEYPSSLNAAEELLK